MYENKNHGDDNNLNNNDNHDNSNNVNTNDTHNKVNMKKNGFNKSHQIKVYRTDL